MARLGKGNWDDQSAVVSDLIPDIAGQRNLGSAEVPFKHVFADNISGDETLPNNTFLKALDSGGSSVGLLKLNTGGDTVINAQTGNVIDFRFNDVDTAAIAAAGAYFPGYFLASDSANINHNISTSASGTAYSLTNTSTALTFGTSSPTLVLDKAGTYVLLARVNLEYAGATFASNRTVTLKLRRTNNTAADLTGGTTSLGTNVVTTASGIMSAALLPPVFYTTTNTNDIVTIFGDVSVAPSAGALNATEANIIAFRIV